jgi:hypothetical protein
VSIVDGEWIVMGSGFGDPDNVGRAEIEQNDSGG